MPHGTRLMNRRRAITALLGASTTTLAGCIHGKLLGYSTKPNYDDGIRTIYVPVFRSRFLETNPYRGAEFTLTRAVIDAIESKTPYKVVSDPVGADTELQGTLVSINKSVLFRNPFNETRELALVLTAEIVWFDLRPENHGRILTNPRRRDAAIPITVPFDPDNQARTVPPDQPKPVILTEAGRALPELGESNTTALHQAIHRLATKVVSAMEEHWE